MKDYPLGELLGSGSYGTVYQSSLGGIPLAVKVIEKRKRISALLEASIAERVAGHTNLVELKDALLRADGCSMLVYLHGGQSLEDICKSITIDVPRARCMLDCLAGLSYLHSLWLYHGDVKPGNILVQREEGVFKRARVADLHQMVEVCPGNVRIGFCATTFQFQPPELLRGQKEASGALWLRADVWALGITLCRLAGFSFIYNYPAAARCFPSCATCLTSARLPGLGLFTQSLGPLASISWTRSLCGLRRTGQIRRRA